jgi:hypothetical protein
MKIRTILDLSKAPPSIQVDELSAHWNDVTAEYPALTDAEVAVLEFDDGSDKVDWLEPVRPALNDLDSALRLIRSDDGPGSGFAPAAVDIRQLLPTRQSPPQAPDAATNGGAWRSIDLEAGIDYEWRLLNQLDDDDRQHVIHGLLRERVALRAQAVRRAAAEARVVDAHARYEGERVKHLAATIGGVAERVNHMKEWRRIAKWGVGILIATTAVAAWALRYLLTGPVEDGTMSGETFSLVVFVLALFAASPAMLLLLERPLKGLDSWSPGGKSDATKAAEGSDEDGGNAATAPRKATTPN